MTTSSWAANLWHSRNDVPSIEGMRHGGIAEQLRKKYTVFGSKTDRVRQLAKMFGMSFEELVESQGFKEAMAKGIYAGKLGEGSFGVIEKYKSSYRGHIFSFATKSVHENAEANLRTFLADADKFKGIEKALDLSQEARTLLELRGAPAVPEFYHLTEEGGKQRMFMEFLPGKNLEHVAGAEISQVEKESLKESLERATSKGIYNPDLHAGNIMIGPKGEVYLPDWGWTRSATELATEGRTMEGAKEKMRAKVVKAFRGQGSEVGDVLAAEGTTAAPRRRRPSLQASSQDLTSAQQQIWESAISGGRGHERKASAVDQLSRFSGQSITKR